MTQADIGGRSGGTIVPIARGQLMPLVQERLVKALGPKRAGEVLADACAELGDRRVDTPQELLVLGDILLRGPGLVQAVGRSLKVHALLLGAVEK